MAHQLGPLYDGTFQGDLSRYQLFESVNFSSLSAVIDAESATVDVTSASSLSSDHLIVSLSASNRMPSPTMANDTTRGDP